MAWGKGKGAAGADGDTVAMAKGLDGADGLRLCVGLWMAQPGRHDARGQGSSGAVNWSWRDAVHRDGDSTGQAGWSDAFHSDGDAWCRA